ncbi:MarR family transcriptional regulator [Microbacterium protaetiae]|uniref:MarR family transcriptional regulator n=1 Tax=Microbacterium protaetiae TaxID=2509458 RepID=A0A4P6EDP3_9MICO|nr:MarR family winged helix-turn-helix transcriptional regulator [Microbacterium protaetiae]QAY59433.1 MarR family transcriptional regulator [Microbacterium protaetiae]
MSDASPDPADVIAAALARLRARRLPPPGAGGGRHHGDPSHGDLHRGIHADMHQRGRRGIPDPFDPRTMPAPGMPWSGAHGRFGGPARVRLLEALAAASTPLSVSELAERIGVDQPRASRLVQQCVGLGFVRREADPDDARRTRIVLTEQGNAVISGFRGNRRAAIEDALAEFTDAERAELARLLTKLADSWGR